MQNVPMTVAAHGRVLVPAFTDLRSLTNPTISGIAPNGPSSMVPHKTTPANNQPSAGSTHRDFVSATSTGLASSGAAELVADALSFKTIRTSLVSPGT